MVRGIQACALMVAAGAVPLAAGAVTFQTQQRTISATTTSNGNSQTESAPDFAPFVRTIAIANTFPGPVGPITNTSSCRIDCQIDPNSVRAAGVLSGAGGLSTLTGNTEIGDSKVAIRVTFLVSSAVPFNLLAAPRPDLHATDEFVLELRNLTTNTRLISLDATDAPQQVDFSGVLQPGEYSMQYKIETTVDGAETERSYFFNLAIPTPGSASVLVMAALVMPRRRRRYLG